MIFHVDPGLRLRRLPFCPVSVAFPDGTVIVRPPRLTSVEDVPFVIVKLPPAVVLMFWPLKSRRPFVFKKLAQANG